ncbi:hypothetical protein TD95_002024 [Thielaviopsis punctulata]|uniref:DNA repair and recombination protein RAD26 n=1 Tax=Thielaviopsis punctulata TaxID=72032 RepID=A0A0F4ZAS6_9PEZI|nr:hypothetical protein TD95_002024 [Thielaviopsis punctulata]
MDSRPSNSVASEAEAVAAAISGFVNVRQQADLQRDITSEANTAIFEQENQRDEERIASLKKKIVSIQTTKTQLSEDYEKKNGNPIFRVQAAALRKKIDKCAADVQEALDEIEGFKDRIARRIENHEAVLKAKASTNDLPQTTDKSSQTAAQPAHSGPTQQDGESLEEYLIRTGKITPFALQSGKDIQEVLGEQEALAKADRVKPHQQLRQPGFASQSLQEVAPIPKLAHQEFNLRTRKRKHVSEKDDTDLNDFTENDEQPARKHSSKKKKPADDDDYTDDASFSDSEDINDYDDVEEDSKASRAAKALSGNVDFSRIDDGNEKQYRLRLINWSERRADMRRSMGLVDENPDEKEFYKPTPGKDDVRIMDGYSLPGEVGEFLFPFQKVGVEWLCQLHSRLEGGLLCDEMGLGKTVQIIAMIVALHYSKKLEGPAIILAPSTLMVQWVQHFHTWWPPLRVSILHSTGSGMMDPEKEDCEERDSLTPKKVEAARRIIGGVVGHGHVLITTYKGLQTYIDELSAVNWGYVALDEGHLIRNRNTEASKACKQLATYNRIVMSGTPIQNNLRELFSLFEFAYPGLLGTDTRSFSQHFEMPIRDGYHRNATNLAIMTAEKCARTLREAVKPYMLRRIKADVADSLPPKSEQVFFCKLTPQQEETYVKFINSPHIKCLLNDTQHKQQRNAVFAAIDTLRKICNHPDLRWGKKYKSRSTVDASDFGNPERSTKMQVLISLLRISKNFGHKTLVFSQSLPMLDIIETYLKDEGYSYVRMDGSTNQIDRQPMVDRFNKSSELEVFLLTPQTGGVGLNLTGANRVILFDPSWNPATDKQAVERAWRLGQKRPVEIYRLLTPGTIEEKIYRKQLYKQFMTDKIMTDTQFHRSFDSNSLADMFSYVSDKEDRDLDMFDGTESKPQSSKALGGDAKITSSKSGIAKTSAAVLSTEEAAAVADVNQIRAIEEFHEEKTEEEKGMLDDLFTRSIDSAYNHDDILNAKKRVQANRRFLEEEAERLNAETKLFLKQQAARAYHERHGAQFRPTASAVAGRPAVLAQAPRRNKPVIEKMWTLRSLQAVITEFFEQQGGQAYTADITRYFNSKYTDLPADLFKKALESVARMGDAPGKAKKGMKLWKLKGKREI